MNLWWLIFFLGTTKAMDMHYATSTRDSATLLKIEDELIEYTRQYARELQLKKEWMTRRALGHADPTIYVSNPLISFPLMRRMYTDVHRWMEIARQEVKQGPLQKLVGTDLTAVSEMELEMAATGLLRIQSVYGLNESDMANGKLHNKQYKSRLSSADCLALGIHLESLQKGKHACKWLKISLDQYEDKLDPVNRLLQTGRSQIYEKLGLTLLSLHDLPASQAALKKSVDWASKNDNTYLANHLVDNLSHMFVHLDNCRGKNLLPRKSSLRCRYFTEGSPFLGLAPLKLEQLNFEPFIGLFHNVISPAEQKDLLTITKSSLETRKLDRSSVEAEVQANATSNVERLHRRLEDMTGLNLEESEPLTVSNFGIGGQHFIHLDCKQPKEFVEPFDKEYRTATVQLYLSDVQMGGYVSFPDLGFGFKPNRGSALVWHNIDNSGNCDIRSLQGTCPVLLGKQWVARKWISGSGQWRRKPCRK